MVFQLSSTRSNSGPRLYQMLLFVVALTFAFYVFAGTSAPVQMEENSLGPVFLEGSYLLYFEPTSEKDPEYTLANRKRYSQQYETLITQELNGSLNQQYDTLLVGFGFSLSYTENVMEAIGLKEIPKDVEASTLVHLQQFLENYAGEDMTKDNVRMLLEKDGEVRILS